MTGFKLVKPSSFVLSQAQYRCANTLWSSHPEHCVFRLLSDCEYPGAQKFMRHSIDHWKWMDYVEWVMERSDNEIVTLALEERHPNMRMN